MSYNKRFLYAGVSAPGTVHNSRARLLKSSSRTERVTLVTLASYTQVIVIFKVAVSQCVNYTTLA